MPKQFTKCTSFAIDLLIALWFFQRLLPTTPSSSGAGAKGVPLPL